MPFISASMILKLHTSFAILCIKSLITLDAQS